MARRELPAGTPQQMRRLNAQHVLDSMWGGAPVTAADLMRETGLTRATVLAVCRELVELGWIEAVDDARKAGSYAKGRPALRYALRRDAGYVVGIDAGQHHITAAVADLRGSEVARAQRSITAEDDGESWTSEQMHVAGQQRRGEILAAVDSALAMAAVDPSQVASMVIGVPAPVDSEGRSPEGLNNFWGRMNPQLSTLGAERGWDCVVENDANLAALAEQSLTSGSQDGSFAVLLSGERFGAGLVLQGELLRQPRGGAGELGVLDLVSGVEGTEGLAAWAREHARELIASGGARGSALAAWSAEEIDAAQVLAAARDGDELARGIVEKLGDRLARICVVLSGPLDLDRIVLTGAVAPSLAEVVQSARRRLPEYIYAPWLELSASPLGADAVRQGAVRFAVERVRAHALEGDDGAG